MPFVPAIVVNHVVNPGRVRPLRGAASALKGLFIMLGGLWLALTVSAPKVFAGLAVDVFQDMESGSDGELLTPSLMGASSHGGGTTWSLNGHLWVSTKNASDLPDPVVVAGVTYAGTHPTRSWRFNDDKHSIRFGQTSAHGDHPDATTQSYFGNILVDYTHAQFPLVPSKEPAMKP